MVDKTQFAEASNLIKQSSSILILLSQNINVDTVASGLALFLSLKKAKKHPQIGCAIPISVAYNRLFGVDQIRNKLGSRNLVISFPYVEEAIEKVSYHVEGHNFNLVIVPKKGFPTLDPKKVTYSQSGIDDPTIIVVGAASLDDLGALYNGEREAIDKAQIINIDIGQNNLQFGKINLVDIQASSAAELVAFLLRETNLPVKEDIATNLLAGIEWYTSNLQKWTRAETFEIISYLMQNGGKRGHLANGRAVSAMAAGYTGQPAPMAGYQSAYLATLPYAYSQPQVSSMPIQAPIQPLTQAQNNTQTVSQPVPQPAPARRR